MFAKLSNRQMELVYLGLKSLIETKSGHGLHNADGGHIVYLMGSKGDISKDLSNSDSPDKNPLFQMLSALSVQLKKAGIESLHYEWWYDFKDWQSFCKFVVMSYKNQPYNGR